MKAVVTGATGFIGKWLVKELLNQKDDVIVIVRNRAKVPKEWEESVHIVELSMKQMKEFNRKDFREERADIFFHFAWNGTSGKERANSELQLQNVQLTIDMVKLAQQLHCTRFVNAGSIMEYEAMQYIPKEGSMPAMGNLYSTAKLTADFMGKIAAIHAGIEYVNVIISNIYGAGESSTRFLNSTLKKMLNHEKIPLTHGNQLYDFIYISDAAKAIILAGKKGEKNTAYYIGNSKQYPLKYFVLQMKEILESKSELLFGEVPFKGVILTYHEFDTEKIERLGFHPEINFVEGITLTKKWILEGENEY